MACSCCVGVMARSSLVALVSAGPLLACAGDTDAVRRYLQTGDSYAANQQFREAAIEYQNAAKRDASSGEARQKLARAYARSDRWQKAIAEFVRAADLLPESEVAQIDAARALLLSGSFEDARTRATRALALNPKSVVAHVVRASATAGMKDFEGAKQAIADGIAADPTRELSFIDMAVLHAATGQQREAGDAFRQAVAVDPKSVIAHVALGSYYWVSGRVAEAEQSYRTALSLDPANQVANRALANLYLASGRVREAEGPLRAAAAASNDPEQKLLLADYYIAGDRLADARTVLDLLAARSATYAIAVTRLAAIDYRGGDRARAYALLDSVLAQEPTNTQVIVVKSWWLFAEGRVDQALALARSAVKFDSESPETQFVLGSILAAKGEVTQAVAAFNVVLALRPSATEAQIALAHLQLDLGHVDTAGQFAEQAVKSEPHSRPARFARARVLLAQRKIDSARAEVQLLIDSPWDVAKVHELKGEIEETAGNTAAARGAFERAIALESDSLQGIAGLVRLDLAADRPDEAKRRAERHLASAPDDVPLLLLVARIHAATEDFRRAEMALKKAVHVDPGALEAYRLLGQIYILEDRVAEARQQYERLAQQTNAVAAHTLVAILLHAQGRSAEAQARYEQIVALDPTAAVASNNLAYLYAEADTHLDKALQLAQAAKAALPTDADVDDTLGWVYYKRNLPTLAADHLEASVRRNPANPVSRYHLALTYLRLGHGDRARLALEEALRMEPGFVHAEQARRLLRSTEP